MILLKEDMYELQTLHPIIEERANKLLNDIVEFYETITRWQDPKFIEYNLKDNAPYFSSAKYKYTNGTDLYYEEYDRYEKKSRQSVIPFSWLLNEQEWKSYIETHAMTVKAYREKVKLEKEQDKRTYDLKKLRELIETYYDEAEKIILGS